MEDFRMFRVKTKQSKKAGLQKTGRVDEESKISGSSTTEPKKLTPGQLRLSKDIAELDIPKNATVKFANEEDNTIFEVIVKPEEESYWYGGTYSFTVKVTEDYPHEPPKVTLNTKIFHPNIDYKGNISLNILRQDWSFFFTLNFVIFGLLILFLEPNPNDCLNAEAGELMRTDKKLFAETVINTLKGESYKTEAFSKML